MNWTELLGILFPAAQAGGLTYDDLSPKGQADVNAQYPDPNLKVDNSEKTPQYYPMPNAAMGNIKAQLTPLEIEEWEDTYPGKSHLNEDGSDYSQEFKDMFFQRPPRSLPLPIPDSEQGTRPAKKMMLGGPKEGGTADVGQTVEPEDLGIIDYSKGKTGRANKPQYIIGHDVSGDPKTRKLPNPQNISAYHYQFDDKGIYRILPENVAGAHATTYNPKSIGIAYRGFEGDELSPAALANARKLVNDIAKRYGIPPENILTHPGLGSAGTRTGGKDKREAAWIAKVLAGDTQMATAQKQPLNPELAMALGLLGGTAAFPEDIEVPIPQRNPGRIPLVEQPTRAVRPAAPQAQQQVAEQPPQQRVQQRAATEQVQNEARQAGWGNSNQGFLANPANRAFLISMGTQMMVGGWGNSLSQLGVAIGRGAEAAAATTNLAEENERARLALEQKATEGQADRDNRIAVANIGATSRQNVASMRGQYALQRAAMSGAKSPNELAAYNAVYNNATKRLTDANMLKPPDQQLTEEQIMAQAAAEADAQYQRYQQRGAGGLRAGRPNAGASNSEIPAEGTPSGESTQGAGGASTGKNKAAKEPSGFVANARAGAQAVAEPGYSFWDKVRQGGEAVGAIPKQGAKPKAGAPTDTKPAAQAGKQLAWQEYIALPGVQEALQDPNFRAQLLKRRPDFAKFINQIESIGAE